ncbi:MAG: NAD-dependent epimerase/dehydratase family protein [Actinomycetia bacterium]|nr:NAD-dependent epimerase/dehydratase family protein [Actinomycetes bacterium]MCP4088009.1 NAD-dependent epimerase/dehydratase family protein [Actinomycetes bacterium]
MRAFITGYKGFVAGHLTTHLLTQGDEVDGTDREDGPDLLDRDGWFDVLADRSPEVVYHLAAQAAVGNSWDNPLPTIRANIEGTHNVLEAARHAGVERMVVISSSDVYGRVEPGDLPLTEDRPPRPVSPYAASKAAAEMLALQAWHGFQLPTVLVRPFNHIGPGQSGDFVASALALRIAAAEAAGEYTITVGDLSARRDFTDVRDVVRAYRLLAQHGTPGGTYHVCSEIDRSIQELVDTLIGQALVPVELVPDKSLLRPAEVPVLRGSAARLRADTSWEPMIDFQTSIKDILREARERVGAGNPARSDTP